jgi:hypothetical protein
VLRSWRLLARVSAIVLLTWTAVDLMFPECCLAETLWVTEDAADSSDAPRPSQPPVDDCFCCAMCIDTGVHSRLLRIEAVRTLFAEPLRHLASRVADLDHPPQNA